MARSREEGAKVVRNLFEVLAVRNLCAVQGRLLSHSSRIAPLRRQTVALACAAPRRTGGSHEMEEARLLSEGASGAAGVEGAGARWNRTHLLPTPLRTPVPLQSYRGST